MPTQSRLFLQSEFQSEALCEFCQCYLRIKLKSNIPVIFHDKLHIFWEGHKILQNLQLTFDCMYCSQKLGEDLAKFCGLLRIYELYFTKRGKPILKIGLKSFIIFKVDHQMSKNWKKKFWHDLFLYLSKQCIS